MSGQGLYWLGLAAGFAGVVAYFVALAQQPRWGRLLTHAGLFFTSVGLMQTAVIIREAGFVGGASHAKVAIIALALAVAVQSLVAVRHAPAWDGAGEQPSDPAR